MFVTAAPVAGCCVCVVGVGACAGAGFGSALSACGAGAWAASVRECELGPAHTRAAIAPAPAKIKILREGNWFRLPTHRRIANLASHCSVPRVSRFVNPTRCIAPHLPSKRESARCLRALRLGLELTALS